MRTGREEHRPRDSSQRPSAFSTVIIRNLPGARASVGICDLSESARGAYSQLSCSNPSVAAPVVARLNSNGLMSLLTRTERSVSFSIPSPLVDNPHRTTSVIVSMLPPVGGRKTRTFIGTIVTKSLQKKSVGRRSVKSRRQRQRRSPLHCMPHSLFPLPFLDTHSHTHSGFGPSKKEPSSSTQGTGTNAIPLPPSTPASTHVDPDAGVKAAEKAERRQQRKERKEEKAARRAERAARKEQRRVHNGRSRHDDSPPRSLTPVHRQRDSRSPSPSPRRHRSHDIAGRDDPQDDRYRRRSRGFHSPDGGRFRDRRSSRSRSPPRRDSRSHSELPPRRPTEPRSRYDEDERESERSRDRQGWNRSAMRQTPGGGGLRGRK